MTLPVQAAARHPLCLGTEQARTALFHFQFQKVSRYAHQLRLGFFAFDIKDPQKSLAKARVTVLD
jgi:hypothetical protein